jgi:predicted nucleic acid-binding protein
MRIFLDASALVPLELVRDQWHEPMRRLMSVVRRQRNVRFVTSNWTFYEALSLARRAGVAQSLALHDRVRHLAKVANVTPDEEREALGRFLSWVDHGASVVDHANLLVAVRHRCDALISFDADFVPLTASAGIRLLR